MNLKSFPKFQLFLEMFTIQDQKQLTKWLQSIVKMNLHKDELFFHPALLYYINVHSTTLEDNMAQAKKLKSDLNDSVMTLAQKLVHEGEIKGRLEGELKGKLEGKLEGKQETLYNLLKLKFRVVSPDQQQMIENCQFIEKLETAASLVFTENSLESIIKVLQ